MSESSGCLAVDFSGEVHDLAPGQELSFGRAADIRLDENRHLHRRVGRFVHHDGMWWTLNEGSSLPITVVDSQSSSRSVIAPGCEMPMVFERAAVRVTAGGIDYEILTSMRSSAAGVPEDTPDMTEETTTTGREIPLNDEQRLLLAAFAELSLMDPHLKSALPTNRETAARLGWSITKLNRKLDHLCNRFTREGVTGLRGSPDRLAIDRRERLVAYAIEQGLVGVADLKRLCEATTSEAG